MHPATSARDGGTARHAAWIWLCLLFLGAVARDAVADSIFVAAGRGSHSTVTGMGVQLDRRRPLREWPDHTLTVHLEVLADALFSERSRRRNDPIGALAFIPNLRWSYPGRRVERYWETGFGVRTLTRTSDPEDRRFSTNFQFGEFVGAGLRFGAARQFETSARIEHISNGGIRKPNGGATFLAVHVGWYFP